MASIELICVALLAFGLVLRARAGGLAGWLRDAPIVCCAALLAEDTCIRAYGFYSYAPEWHAFVGTVPLLVGVIWIFVVLSARDVARSLRPAGVPLLGLAVITYDAALIEPIATQAGLWRWHEAGPFAVPWMGMLGWGLFGASILYWLDRLSGTWRWAAVLLAPLTTHVLLLVIWWGLLRWVGRSEPPMAALAVAAAVVSGGLAVWAWRVRAVRSVPFPLIAPRLAPAGFFFGLMAVSAAPLPLWLYAATFALPWLAVTRWRTAPAATTSVYTTPLA